MMPCASATTPTESSARTVTAFPSSAVASVWLTTVIVEPDSMAVPVPAEPAARTSKERLSASARTSTLPVQAISLARSPALAMTDWVKMWVLTLAPAPSVAALPVAASMA